VGDKTGSGLWWSGFDFNIKIMLSLSTLYSGALDFDTLHEKEREHDHALIFDAFNNIVKGYFWMFRGAARAI
jgi:hypothetical protein